MTHTHTHIYQLDQYFVVHLHIHNHAAISDGCHSTPHRPHRLQKCSAIDVLSVFNSSGLLDRSNPSNPFWIKLIPVSPQLQKVASHHNPYFPTYIAGWMRVLIHRGAEYSPNRRQLNGTRDLHIVGLIEKYQKPQEAVNGTFIDASFCRFNLGHGLYFHALICHSKFVITYCSVGQIYRL